MAINLGRKYFLQIPRSFVAGGTGVNSRFSSGLARAARPNAHRPHTPANIKYPGLQLFVGFGGLGFCGLWLLDHSMGGQVQADLREVVNKLGEKMKKTMEDKGVSRAFYEAKMEELKQKIKSGSASED